ncbi:MAG: pyridoxamine kinase [Spirochaetaceae bacterium]|jgi:pyridoxine kinase|nr:pyridoxamine kinase [Spirochaetaceae bacterium]
MGKRIAAVHDLSGFGRSSLTVVTPILSTMGIQVCPLPTAILSTQTSGFENYHFVDLTEHLKPIISHWKDEKITFDGIYTGFLGSYKQVNIIHDFIDEFKQENSLIVVDPVMGDDGELYGPYTMNLVTSMKDLIIQADLITPNYTEAAFLLDKDPKSPPPKLEEIKHWLKTLSMMGPRRVVISSVPHRGNTAQICAYDRLEDRYWKCETQWLPASYPGTGDMLASVLTGSLLQGESLSIAMDRAVGFILHAIRSTYDKGLPQREGVLLEKSLGVLFQPAICKTRIMN